MTLPSAFLPLLMTFAGPSEAADGIELDFPIMAAPEKKEGHAADSHAAKPEAPAPAPPKTDADVLEAEEVILDDRRRPGTQQDLPDKVEQDNPGAVRPPPPEAFPQDPDFPLPDRWRLSQALSPGLNARLKPKLLDPYNQNILKGDRPLCIPSDEEQERREKAGEKKCGTPKFLGLKAEDWFFVATAISDTIVEQRTFPIPVGNQTTTRPGSNDVFGKSHSVIFSQTVLFGASLIQGMTAFLPPHREYRALFALNGSFVNVPERRVLNVRPSKKSHRWDRFLGVQEFFIDDHLRNVSDRFDFDSIRIGIQPFQADFRGFLFNDQQLGVRLFGNRDNNRYQYNLAIFSRLEKDTNSGLNSVVQTPRKDWIFFGNLYRQDFPVVGLTSQISATVNVNRERNQIHVDDNGFPSRPSLLGDLRGRNYDVAYLGYSVDGRIGRVNLTATTYAALGSDRNSIFTGRKAKIRSFFFAAEPSIDFDWARFRLSALYASGDSKPYDNVEGGFDAIFENPVFAGADTSYWIRQSIPFAGGGRAINVNQRNGLLANLRSSKEEGQSNFSNPGTVLIGAGGDFDITPTLRVSASVNHMWFENTATIKALRIQGNVPKSIGLDASFSTIWRPSAIQNVVFRASAAALDPGKGFARLFTSAGRDKRYVSLLFNAIITY